jgi:mRNA interferase HigB
MRVISRKRLQTFAREHPASAEPLEAWYQVMHRRMFESPHDLKQAFGSADFLGQGRTIFDIGGNKYRLASVIHYDRGRVFVRHVLTHEEYLRRLRADTLWGAN